MASRRIGQPKHRNEALRLALLGESTDFLDSDNTGVLDPFASMTGYANETVTLNGTNQRVQLSAALTGLTSLQKCVISFWIKPNADTASDTRILDIEAGSSQRFRLIRKSGGVVQMLANDNLGATLINENFFDAAPNLLVANGTRHVLICYDLDTAGQRNISYIDGVFDQVDAETSGTIDTAVNKFSVGAREAGSQHFDGCISEFYVCWGEDIFDTPSTISAADIAKFYSASGPPGDLTNVLPTVPQIYLKQGGANFGANAGQGQDFTQFGTTPFTECSGF